MNELAFFIVAVAALNIGFLVGAWVQWHSIKRDYHLKPRHWTLPRGVQ